MDGALEGYKTPTMSAIPQDLGTPDEVKLLTTFQDFVQVPQWIAGAFRQMEADRKYVSEDAFMKTTQDSVAVNYVLRNQYVAQAFLGFVDPKPSVQPRKQVGMNVDPAVDMFGQTMEIHLERVGEEMNFAPQVDGVMQDTMTNGIGWLKITFQRDPMKNPIGQARFGDVQHHAIEYAGLQSAFAAKQFTENDAKYAEMKAQEGTLRQYMAQEMLDQQGAGMNYVPAPADPASGVPPTNPDGSPIMVPDPADPREQKRQAILDGKTVDLLGCPELQAYVGFACDQILPEDMRWDWSCMRPEDLPQARWIAQRVYMTPQEVASKFQIPLSDLGTASMFTNGKPEEKIFSDFDPARRAPELESSTRSGTVAVWELWHRGHGRRYVWVQGVQRFLVNEVPTTGRRFYPFFAFYFNRASGQLLPISDVQMQRSSQDEYNMLRTWDREWKRAAAPVLFIGKGLMNSKEKALYRNRMPFSVIEVERPDEVAAQMKESVTVPYNPQITTSGVMMAERDIQMMAGIPFTAGGTPDSGQTATENVIAKQGMDSNFNRRRTQGAKTISAIYQYIAEISLRIYPEVVIQQRYGPQAVWPYVSTDEMYLNLAIEIKGGVDGEPDAQKKMDLWKNFAGICQQLQLPVNGPEVLKELLEAVGIRANVNRFIAVPLPGAPMEPGQPGAPGSPPPNAGHPPEAPRPPPQTPEQQGPQGAAGGAPPMNKPPQQGQIPNGPKPPGAP